MKRIIKSIDYKRVFKSGMAFLVEKNEFDENGNLIWVQRFFETGDIQTESNYQYENGKLVSEKNWNEFGDSVEIEYTYNPNGQLILKESKYLDSSIEKEEREITPKKDITRMYDYLGNLYSEIILFYDEQHRVVKNEFYNDGKLTERNFFIYDQYGKLITQKSINNETDDKYYVEIEYDREGNTIREVEKTEKGELIKEEINEYYRKKLIKSEEQIFGKDIDYKLTSFEYDFKDNLIKEICKNRRGDIIYYLEMEYNENGDYIRMFTIDKINNDGLGKQIIREIEYY